MTDVAEQLTSGEIDFAIGYLPDLGKTIAEASLFREHYVCMTRKDYTDNWVSECHERFTDMNLDAWRDLLTDVGFEVDVASHAWRNDWIVEHRIDPVAALTDLDGRPLPWPDTHVLLVARRPLVADEGLSDGG